MLEAATPYSALKGKRAGADSSSKTAASYGRLSLRKPASRREASPQEVGNGKPPAGQCFSSEIQLGLAQVDKDNGDVHRKGPRMGRGQSAIQRDQYI